MSTSNASITVPPQAVKNAFGASSTASGQAREPITKLVVAIHGIGSQTRSDTIRSTARQFGLRSHLPTLPLGFFHISNVGSVRFSRLDAPPGSPLADIGFVEVFWADVPRRLASSADTLEETKAWGRSIVSRAQATYLDRVSNHVLYPEDFDVGVGVIEEIIESIAVLENLLFLADKAGLFKFDLAALLRDYVNDVQVVTEFAQYREEIVFRFHLGLANVLSDLATLDQPMPDIYVVAHSEGTVVSFLAMLQALSKSKVANPNYDPSKPADPRNNPVDVGTDWIEHLRGFMTIGSPIDKHLLLWPKLWTELLPDPITASAGGIRIRDDANGNTVVLEDRIQWRNYYDYGDPVGFRLETACDYLDEKQCEAFQFDARDDVGFARYVFPGKAHVDYWGDADVFSHFIDTVVRPVLPPPPTPRPQSKLKASLIGLPLPYLVTYVVHIGAVFALYKGVMELLGLKGAVGALEISTLAALLMGITVAARLPRLTKSRGEDFRIRWFIVAGLAFVVGALPCVLLLPHETAEFVGRSVEYLPVISLMPDANKGRALLVLAAGVVALVGWLTPRKARVGRRALIISGLVVALIFVAPQLVTMPSSKVIWPTVLGFAGFLYLWWLGVLLFDLSFVWHRYIRRNVAIETVDEWTKGWNTRPYTGWSCETRPQPLGSQNRRWPQEYERGESSVR